MTAATLSTAKAVDYVNGRLTVTGRRRRVGPGTMRKWAATGYAPAARVGLAWVWHPTALDAWMASGLADWSKRNERSAA